MAGEHKNTGIDPSQLPDTYDELMSAEKLVHGDHNPRRLRPTATLKESVAQDGLDRPLIVHPDDADDIYHITDGWQRYQAAIDCGWEQLPVKVYETTLDALQATETVSIVREWSKYEWASYCKSLAEQFDADSRQALIEHVASQTIRSPQTVRRYLDVMSLPVEIHPLLKDGPEGSQRDWATLRNFNDDVRQYSGLWWTVAAQIARGQSLVPRSRIVEIAAQVVEFELADDAMEFVELALEEPRTDLSKIRRQVLLGSHHNQYLLVPRVPVRLQEDQREAILEYCHRNRISLSEVVTKKIKRLADDLAKDSSPEVMSFES